MPVGRTQVGTAALVIGLTIPTAASLGRQSEVACCSGAIPIHTVAPVVSPFVYSGGTVVARVFVNDAGRVDDVQIITPVAALVEPVLESLRQWRFAPPTVDGRPVPSCTTVAVHVELLRTVYNRR